MTESSAARSELSNFKTKVFYGFGSFAYGVKDFGFGQILLIYYNQIVGLSPARVGAAIFIALVFDAFADPIVGQISDNLRTRWGRRHPFMYASAVPVGISFFFLFNPPHWSPDALFFYLIGMAIIVRTFITMYEIPSSALVPEMTANYDDRTSFLSYRYFFGIGGAVVIGFITFFYLFATDSTHRLGQLNPASYTRFGLVAAALMVTSILISARGTHHAIRYLRVPPARRISLRETLREMAAALSHRSFLILVATALCGATAIGLGTQLLLYFNTVLWGLSAKQVSLFALTGLFAAILPPLIAPPVSRRFQKRNAALIFFVLSIAVSATPISLRLLGLFVSNGSPLLVPLLFAERATSATLGVGCLILFSSMIADVVEESELRTGRRSEGLFFAAMSFVTKSVTGLGAFIAGQMLSLVHFPAHATPATVDPSIVRHLALVYLPTLILLYGMGMLVLSRYRITREHHEENLRQLSESSALSGDKPGIEQGSAERQVDYVAARAGGGLGG